MVAWVVKEFGGEIPRRSARLLPDEMAEMATNVDLSAGPLNGLPQPEKIVDLSSAPFQVRKAYRFPGYTPALPDVPTMAEAGYPEVEGQSWFAVVVPAGTPKEIIARLNREIAKAVTAPDVKQRLAVLGYAEVSSSPEDCAAIFKAEAAKWTKVIRVSGAKGE